MSHSNKHDEVPLLTEGELHNTTQQHDMANTDEWTPKGVSSASIVKSLRASIGGDDNPHSIDHAVGRSRIESAQFDVGVDMITVRMDARSMKGNPQDVFGPEITLIRPCVPRRGTRVEAPKVSQADQVTRKWSIALYIFESPVRVTVGSVDGIPGVTVYCEFNPSHVQHEQRIRPATIDETHDALQTLDDFLRPYFNGLNHRLSWDIYRLDLAVDFTPDGPTHEIHSQALLSFRRGRAKIQQYFDKKAMVETTECRSKKAGSLKMYDKRRQMKAVHKVDIGQDLMRIEYQIKRSALLDKIRTVGELTQERANTTMESRIKFFIKRLQPEMASTEIVINEEE
jgi:hypothetical protein